MQTSPRRWTSFRCWQTLPGITHSRLPHTSSPTRCCARLDSRRIYRLFGEAAAAGWQLPAASVLAVERNLAFSLLSTSPECSSGPHIDVTLGLKEDQLRLSSVPDHTVAARLKRTLLVTSEVRASMRAQLPKRNAALQ